MVIGLGPRGRAACSLLSRRGAKVLGVDHADNQDLRDGVKDLEEMGVEIKLGQKSPPKGKFDLVVVSPILPANADFVRQLEDRDVPVISELELGFQQTKCLVIGITGTNGKSTTAELIERILANNQRKTTVAGQRGRPVCQVAEQTRDLDYLTVQVTSFQLQTTKFFRPAVGVLLNLAPDHLDRYGSTADYVRDCARLFENQQQFDWAIVQSEALAQLRALDIEIPSKVITFSANNRRADLVLERGLLISRLPGWEGPLLDMEQCRLRGPHQAENIMAALAVGHVLRLALETMVEPVKSAEPRPHCCELVAEVNGVEFINDSKATNMDALQRSLEGTRPGDGGEPNVFLIAGGCDKGLEYHSLGPLISRRVKQAILIGEAREKIRAAWSLFTPCATVDSLLEAVELAARSAGVGDVVLLSPACSSFDQFRNYQQRGEVFRQAVSQWADGVEGVKTKTRAASPDSAKPSGEARVDAEKTKT